MSEESAQKGNKKHNWLAKIISTPAFGLVCLVFTILINIAIAIVQGDWKWAVITVIVLGVLLFLMYFLSGLMREERKDIMQNIIKEDGVLDKYLQDKIEEFAEHGTHFKSIQEGCKKRIQRNFFNTDKEIDIFDIDEILELEKSEVADKGEVWILSDKLGVDVDNKNIYDTVISNVKRNITYKYFCSKKNADVEARFKECSAHAELAVLGES